MVPGGGGRFPLPPKVDALLAYLQVRGRGDNTGQHGAQGSCRTAYAWRVVHCMLI